MKKQLTALCLIACLSVAGNMVSFAGQWQQTDDQWKYQNDDGSYPSNDWQEIDGAYYYFDEDGYITTNNDHFGIYLGPNGAWVPENENVNGKDNLSTLIEDMGLTFGELKAKYGGYNNDNIQKFQLFTNGALFDYDDTNYSSDIDKQFLQILLDDNTNKGAKYGSKIVFANSPLGYQETHTDKFGVAKSADVPNYCFLSDDSGNISDDSKPIYIGLPIKKIFPHLRPGYKIEEMKKPIESMGATNIECYSKPIEVYSDWFGIFYPSLETKISFAVGGHTFEQTASDCENVGLDRCFIIDGYR